MYDIDPLLAPSWGGPPAPRTYRSADAARWAHVLSAMGLTCDPDDHPEGCHAPVLPDFGDGAGNAFFCGPYARDTWPPAIIVAACALVAAGRRSRAVLLGDIMSPRPNMAVIERPGAADWWMERPFSRWSQEELAFRRVRQGGHVAVLATWSGVETVIGPQLPRRASPGLPRSRRGVARLLAEARRMDVSGSRSSLLAGEGGQ